MLRQLKTRDWKYQRSGLFGVDNHQEGGLPVALTLQELHTQLYSRYGSSLFLTNMGLEPLKANIEPCETNIFVATRDERQHCLLAIGECKCAGSCIDADDAREMAKMADALSGRDFSATSSTPRQHPSRPKTSKTADLRTTGVREPV